MPHAHVPACEQVSAAWGLHEVHVVPLTPQVEGERWLHVVPVQQPSGHEVASQTHWPPRQCWPPAQGAPPPQEHVPAVEQLSACVESHAAHTAPPMPQVVNVGPWHSVPVQQPSAQVAEQLEHAPSHVSPTGHAWQTCPPLPHAVTS